MKQRLLAWVRRWLGRDREAVVAHVFSRSTSQNRAMLQEMRQLVPKRSHCVFARDGGIDATGLPAEVSLCCLPSDASLTLLRHLMQRHLAGKRIGLLPSAIGPTADVALLLAAASLAPGKVLAFNQRGERHHLRLRTAVSSWLFWQGVPLDRIYLRPHWVRFVLRGERSRWPAPHVEIEGRPAGGKPRLAVLTPYYPYPLSHGGAVRMFALLREAAQEFDILLVSFYEANQDVHAAEMRSLCLRQFCVGLPYYREPRWSTWNPPEVEEFTAPYVQALWRRVKLEWQADVTQVEYTQLARYPADVLVEHDVTFDLYNQIHQKQPTRASWWNRQRWLWFEQAAVRRFRRVVVMSEKDGTLLPLAHTVVLPNGVDTVRFSPTPEPVQPSLLFVGSFRHFPNVTAFQFFWEQVWPLLAAQHPTLRCVVVGGPDAERHWQAQTGTNHLPQAPCLTVHQFVADVQPLYANCTLVVVPTLVSAGTNLKVLEAMAMQRAVISTPSGCAGIAVQHGESIWIADTAAAFAEGVSYLLNHAAKRHQIAAQARRIAEQHYSWQEIGKRQSQLWHSLIAERQRTDGDA